MNRIFQPEPLLTLVSHIEVKGTTVTAITRTWRPCDTENCRLCQTCAAVDRVVLDSDDGCVRACEFENE